MKAKLLLVLIAGLFVSGNCLAVATKVNRGPIRARTFSFIIRTSKPDLNIADNRETVHKMVQNAITRNLAGHGVSRVDSGGGDVTVAYLIIKGNNASTEGIRDYFGYSDDIEKLHDKAHKVYTRSKNPNHFEAGTLMQQVLINLIFNSLEATQEVAPERRRIIISSDHSNGSARVAVRDFGVGLPGDNPEKVFSHFFSTKPDGMGMGLAIARSIVEAHGGELTAESLSDGSRFSVSLPAEKSLGQSTSG